MKRRLFYLTALALAFGWADTVSADTILASARGDYRDGTVEDELASAIDATGSGTWTYVMSDTANPSDDSSLDTMYWIPDLHPGYWAGTSSGLPGIMADHPGLGTDEMFMCPYAPLFVPRYGVARWIAGVGESGPTSIVGNVRSLDLSGGDGVTFEIFVDGALEFSQVIVLDSVGESFNILTTVGEGSTVDFVVGPNGSHIHDSTALAATISTVPEPSTVAALISMGLMGLAIAWRRRKRAA